MSYETIRNLTVIVAEIQGEGFVGENAPNYPLLKHAASTVHALLQHYWKYVSSCVQSSQGRNTEAMGGAMVDFDTEGGLALHEMMQVDTWGYEHEFWRLLEQQAGALPEQ